MGWKRTPFSPRWRISFSTRRICTLRSLESLFTPSTAEGADHHGMEADAVLAEVANFLFHQEDLHLEVLGIALHAIHRGGDLDRAAIEAGIDLHLRFGGS